MYGESSATSSQANDMPPLQSQVSAYMGVALGGCVSVLTFTLSFIVQYELVSGIVTGSLLPSTGLYVQEWYRWGFQSRYGSSQC